MIRIQLINEGKVVKQITSRVHESVMLEQVKQFKDTFDTIQIVEGELSEDAKSVLQHVARKIIPAAMAAGVAMGGANANAQGGVNPNYPGMDRSIGQHISDIVSPRYNEIQRQRKYEQETQRKEWDAQQGEIRQGRVDNARTAGRAARGATHYKLYDQSRISKDGKFFVIYGMDDKITRIPTAGTEFMAADSQRLAHYISPAGQVYYVRHPHNNGLGESVLDDVRARMDARRNPAAPATTAPAATPATTAPAAAPVTTAPAAAPVADYIPQVGDEVLYRLSDPRSKMMPMPGTVLAVAPGKVTLKIYGKRTIQDLGKDTIDLDLNHYTVQPKQGAAPAAPATPAASAAKPTAVDAKGRTQAQWEKAVMAKYPDAQILKTMGIDSPMHAILADGRKLYWEKAKAAAAAPVVEGNTEFDASKIDPNTKCKTCGTAFKKHFTFDANGNITHTLVRHMTMKDDFPGMPGLDPSALYKPNPLSPRPTPGTSNLARPNPTPDLPRATMTRDKTTGLAAIQYNGKSYEPRRGKAPAGATGTQVLVPAAAFGIRSMGDVVALLSDDGIAYAEQPIKTFNTYSTAKSQDLGEAGEWKAEAEDFKEWSNHVKDALLDVAESQRFAMAKRLSQIETKHFGADQAASSFNTQTGASTGNSSGMTTTVQHILDAINAGKLTAATSPAATAAIASAGTTQQTPFGSVTRPAGQPDPYQASPALAGGDRQAALNRLKGDTNYAAATTLSGPSSGSIKILRTEQDWEEALSDPDYGRDLDAVANDPDTPAGFKAEMAKLPGWKIMLSTILLALKVPVIGDKLRKVMVSKMQENFGVTMSPKEVLEYMGHVRNTEPDQIIPPAVWKFERDGGDYETALEQLPDDAVEVRPAEVMSTIATGLIDAGLAQEIKPKDETPSDAGAGAFGSMASQLTNKTESVNKSKRLPTAEGAMPASVIKAKEKIRLMSDAEKKEYFKGKSKDQLQKMARHHGYGKNINVYTKYATETVTEAKGLHKRVKIVKGPDAGKTGYIRQIEHGQYKGAPKKYDVDIEGGGQANGLPATALRLIKAEQAVAEGVAESMPMADAVKVLKHYGADRFKTTSNELHFYKNGQPFSVDLILNDDATRSVSLSSLNAATRGLKGQGVAEGIATIGTVGTIPASGASSMTTKTKFGQTGSTTDVKFNSKGQLELDDELDADAVDTLKKAGVEVAEATGMSPELSAILDQYADSFEDFKSGGDITDNNDFYEALVEFFSNTNELPYDIATSGDPAEWISNKLNQIGGHQPMGESDDTEAVADQNIIMQIRRAADYEIPVPMRLGDGSTIKIDSQTANKMLAQFNKLKPDSKALMQQTLNTAEGFREMLNYFNEREVQEDMQFIEQISNHMKPITEARMRATNLIKSVFGK